jgi:parvulin-like peptidyl-prolyl isomerase
MDSELGTTEEPKDRTKMIWGGVLALVAVMIAFMWWQGRPDPSTSTVRARHILIRYDGSDPADRQRALATISELRERLQAGERFDTLAREYSDDPTTRSRGGDLLWNEKGVYETNFEEYVWSADIGKLSDVVQTSYGFHLIEVIDRHVSPGDQYEMDLERKAQEAEQRGASSPDSAETGEAPAVAPPAEQP